LSNSSKNNFLASDLTFGRAQSAVIQPGGRWEQLLRHRIAMLCVEDIYQ